MRVDNISDSFSEIGTVVFYKHHKFFPTSFDIITDPIDTFKSDLVKYHGSDRNFPGLNFAEYDFSYFPDKYRFGDKLLLTELDSASAEIVGNKIEDTSNINRVLFPTLVDEETPNPYSYFGSLNVSGKTLYFFECPEEYTTIEIYEDVIDSNCSEGFVEYRYLQLSGETDITSPAAIISLGPERDLFNNPTEFYYEQDPLKNRSMRTKEETTMKYSRLCDEIIGKKVVCFLLSTNDNVMEFNLAFSAWDHSSNPLRNKWKYDLRNDEFYDITKDFTTIEQTSGGVVRDSKAGTILGNTTIDSSLCPIKNRKLEKLMRTQNQCYSPYRKYSKGDNTIYKVKNQNGTYTSYTLESLTNGNIGNDPLLSPSWIIKDRFLDFLTNIIYISLTPEGTGSVINPDTQITVKSDSNVDFNISEGVGYLFSGVSIVTQSTEEVIDLVENVDYTYTLEDTPDEYIKTVNISSWSDFIQPDSERYTSNLIFNFINTPSIIKVLIKKSENIYHYNEWESLLSEYGFGLTFKLNDSIIEPSFSTNDLYLYIPNPQLNPTLEIDIDGDLIKRKVDVSYRVGSNKYTKLLNIEDDTVSDVVNFSEAVWTINLESVTRKLSIRYDNNVICDSPGFVDVDYGSTYTISFSSARVMYTSNRFPFSISVINFFYDENDRIIKNENEVLIEEFPFDGVLILDDVETASLSITQGEGTGVYNLILGNIIENTIIQISQR